MTAGRLSDGDICDKLRHMFHEVIGENLRGEVEKFVLLYSFRYREGADCALVVTTKRDVHAISFAMRNGDEKGQSELDYPHLRSRKLVDLCGLGVTDVAVGDKYQMHYLVTAGNGQLFTWGYNFNGQLCVSQEEVFSWPAPLLLRGPLQERAVVKVACGSCFSVCVTAGGEVWSWGKNLFGQLGNGCTVDSATPCKVENGLEKHRVVSVSCGCVFVTALTDEGQVFSWGGGTCSNRLGRATGGDIDRYTPGPVQFPKDEVIRSVACGMDHTLALTTNGRLYAWGGNDHGQLGNDDLLFQSSDTPLLVNFSQAVSCSPLTWEFKPHSTEGSSSEPYRRHCVTEMAAHHNLVLSAARTASGEVYVWGRCRVEAGKRDIATPMLVPCADLDAAFLTFSTSPSTFRFTSMKPASSSGSIRSSLRNSFDDETTADLKFVAEGRPIHVHKALLKIRSEHFRHMFAKGASWAETEADTINVTEFSYPVYHAFLLYLYTETLADDLTPDDLLGLLDLAQSYCEEELRALCVARVAETIKCDSAPTFYMGAIRCAAEDVEDLCCDFLVQHLTDLASSRALKELGEDLLVTFLEKAAKKKAFRF